MQLLTISAVLFSIGGVMLALRNKVPVAVSFAFWQFADSATHMSPKVGNTAGSGSGWSATSALEAQR